MWTFANLPDRQTTLRPIVRPDAPLLAQLWRQQTPAAAASAAALLIAALIAVALLGALAFGPLVPAAVVLASLGSAAAFLPVVQRNVVAAPRWTFQGRSLDGQGFELLEDIDLRFAYAETNIKRLPTGISWPEVDADVRALLWEAAEHAADVTALDAEIHEMRYAQDGTPQAALKHSLEEQRTAHWDIMRAIQWEAETLARTAGNAVAAARVALARTGSLAALRQITPSRRAIVAAGALAEARSRLELLAQIWAELDETGAIAAERLADDRKKELGSGSGSSSSRSGSGGGLA